MAYLQTTATSVSDIFDTIATFATGLGFTVDRNNTFTSGANTRRILSISFSGFDYGHFFTESSNTTKNTILTLRSIGLTTSGDWDANPNRGMYSLTNLLTGGPYVNLWLFGEAGSNPYIHCLVEHAAGRYRHFGIGELVKMGTWTGGAYSYGTTWGQGAVQTDNPTHPDHSTPFSELTTSGQTTAVTCIRCDEVDTTANGVAGVDNRFIPYNPSSSRRAGSGVRGGNIAYVNSGLGYASTANFSTYNQRAHLLRIRNFVTSSGGYIRQIGEPPALRVVTMEPFQAGEELTIGSDIWKVFPLVRKGIITDQESSGDYAFAYKKVV
jgi:hypothetical protein